MWAVSTEVCERDLDLILQMKLPKKNNTLNNLWAFPKNTNEIYELMYIMRGVKWAIKRGVISEQSSFQQTWRKLTNTTINRE